MLIYEKKKLFKYIDMSETFVIIKKKLINYTVAIVSFKKHDDSQGFVVLKKKLMDKWMYINTRGIVIYSFG